MSLGERYLYRHPSLRRSDVHECLVLVPGELLRDGDGRPHADAGHCMQELSQACLIRIQLTEEVAAGLDLVLRPPGAQPLS